jgi:hypothetical protein
MNIIKEALLKAELKGILAPRKKLKSKYWPGSKRSDTNICHLLKDKTKISESHIQGMCDEFNFKVIFSKDQKPKIETNEK